MEGANADNVRPPAQTRSRSKAKTAHSQAPTTQSEVQSKKTWGSSDSSSEASNQTSNRADHEDTIDESQEEKGVDKENQFLSRPKTAHRQAESPTPARERPEPLKGKELVHPLHTEGLEAIIEHQKKRHAIPATKTKIPANRQPTAETTSSPSEGP